MRINYPCTGEVNWKLSEVWAYCPSDRTINLGHYREYYFGYRGFYLSNWPLDESWRECGWRDGYPSLTIINARIAAWWVNLPDDLQVIYSADLDLWAGDRQHVNTAEAFCVGPIDIVTAQLSDDNLTKAMACGYAIFMGLATRCVVWANNLQGNPKRGRPNKA